MAKRVPLVPQWGTPPKRDGADPLAAAVAADTPQPKPTGWARLRVVVPIVPMVIGLGIAGLRGHVAEAGAAVGVVLAIGILLLRDKLKELGEAEGAGDERRPS